MIFAFRFSQDQNNDPNDKHEPSYQVRHKVFEFLLRCLAAEEIFKTFKRVYTSLYPPFLLKFARLLELGISTIITSFFRHFHLHIIWTKRFTTSQIPKIPFNKDKKYES